MSVYDSLFDFKYIRMITASSTILGWGILSSEHASEWYGRFLILRQQSVIRLLKATDNHPFWKRDILARDSLQAFYRCDYSLQDRGVQGIANAVKGWKYLGYTSGTVLKSQYNWLVTRKMMVFELEAVVAVTRCSRWSGGKLVPKQGDERGLFESPVSNYIVIDSMLIVICKNIGRWIGILLR